MKTDNTQDLFAATPPLDAETMLISMAVTQGVGHTGEDRDKGMCLDFIDISRAFFQADVTRKVYIKLPDGDYEKGMCGLLKDRYVAQGTQLKTGESRTWNSWKLRDSKSEKHHHAVSMSPKEN